MMTVWLLRKRIGHLGDPPAGWGEGVTQPRVPVASPAEGPPPAPYIMGQRDCGAGRSWGRLRATRQELQVLLPRLACHPVIPVIPICRLGLLLAGDAK